MSNDIHLAIDRNSGASLSWQVEKDIERQIAKGVWASADRIPSEQVLAHIYGVARPTVRRAIFNLSRRGVVVRRRGKGTFICRESYAVQQSHAMRTIMFVAGDFDVFGGILKGVEEEALRRGYAVSVGELSPGAEKERLYLKLAQERGASGILIEPVYLLAPEEFRVVRDGGIPMVFIEKEVELEEDFVGGDNRGGMALAIHHLHALGHRRIGYVQHERSQDRPTQPERLAGFLAASRAHGLEVDPSWIVALHDVHGSGPEDEARMGRLLDLEDADRPTAVCCFNDNVASFVMRLALRRGLSIPEDLSVVGWDDMEANHPHVIPLTSLATETRQIGLEAARMLFEKIEHGDTVEKRRVTVMPTLEVRQSTAKPLASQERGASALAAGRAKQRTTI
ncbi:MAG: substrate-binding domain-containing protein [Planctomycetota bacterium]